MRFSENIQFLILVCVLVAAPFLFQGSYLWHVLTLLCIFAILSYSLNISYGYAGQVSFGWCMFWGIGAYASALVALRFGWSFWLAAPIACCIASIVALLIGFIIFRASGLYFALLHMCFALVAYEVSLNWVSLTSGPMGLRGIPIPSLDLPILPEIYFRPGGLSFYYLALTGLLLVIFFTQRLVASPLGRAISSIRENPELASSLGVNVFKYNLTAFCIGAFFAGLGGVFYSYYFRAIDPQIMRMHYVMAAFVMVIIGGKGTLYGPLLGTAFYVLLPEFLRMAGTVRYLVFGIMLILCVIFLPGGIWPVIVRKYRLLK